MKPENSDNLPGERRAKAIDITIFADASWCPHSGAAGWGAWWKGEAMQYGQTQGGSLNCSVSDINEAECMALVNAMAAAAKRGHLSHGMTILLQSDCLGALHAMRHALGAADHPIRGGHLVALVGRLPKQLKDSPVLPVVTAMVLRLELTVLVRHVKGHSKGHGRNWVNRECDRLARKGMEARRNQLKVAREKR